MDSEELTRSPVVPNAPPDTRPKIAFNATGERQRLFCPVRGTRH